MLKFTNTAKTAAQFGNAFFCLTSPEEWDSIGDGPTREAVQRWLAEGNTPEPYVPPSPKPEVLAELRTLREGIYKPLDLMQMRALSTEDDLKVDVEACKQKLRDFPATVEPLLTDGMTREEMRATVKAQYKALAADSPEQVRSAFRGLA